MLFCRCRCCGAACAAPDAVAGGGYYGYYDDTAADGKYVVADVNATNDYACDGADADAVVDAADTDADADGDGYDAAAAATLLFRLMSPLLILISMVTLQLLLSSFADPAADATTPIRCTVPLPRL